MELTRFVRVQLALFVVATLVGAVVLGSVFLRVPALLGFGTYEISAEFADAARLYEQAEVTYRGRPVGEVRAVSLTDRGVRAELTIDSDVQIPGAVRADVRSQSAVGEQYVDLVADAGAGDVLAAGQSIPQERTTVPVQIGPILDQVNSLVAALPRDDLNTVVDESYAAMRGAGPNLQKIIDGGGNLLEAADRNYEPTARLIDGLGPLLDTQTEIDPQLRSLTRDLAGVTDQLRQSDPDIRGLLADTPPFTRAAGGLLDDLRPTLPRLLDNTIGVADLLKTYNPNLRQVLAVYPALATVPQNAIPPNGEDHKVNVDLDVAVSNPPPCTQGFLPGEQWRDPADTSPAPPPDAYCRLPADDPSAVRGARNTPCAEFPGRRAASPAECGSPHRGAVAPGNPPFPPDSALGSLTGADQASPAAPNGVPLPPNDQDGATEPEEDRTWQHLILKTVGR